MVGISPSLWHILFHMDSKEPEKDFLKAEAKRLTDDFAELYQERVLSSPHRTVELTGRKCDTPMINTTLLGFELQIRDKRFSCPDMPTALFLKIFAMIGSQEVKVPLDPTRTAEMLPFFEIKWRQFNETCRELEAVNLGTAAARMHRRLKERLRDPGPKKVPEPGSNPGSGTS